MNQKHDPSTVQQPDLEARLRASRPRGTPMPQRYRQALRDRLLQRYKRPRRYRRWRAAGSLVLLLCVVLGAWGWRLIDHEPRTPSQIVQHTAQTYAAQANSGAGTYMRALITKTSGVFISPSMFSITSSDFFETSSILAEQWRSTDGQQFRYQLTNRNGVLLYFAQRDGADLWRSVHTQMIGTAPLTNIYHSTITNESDLALMPPLAPWLTQSDFAGTCADFGCWLADEWWNEATLLTKDLRHDQRPVVLLERTESPRDASTVFRLRIDTASYQLLEIRIMSGGWRMAIWGIEQYPLDTSGLEANFFHSLPPVPIAEGQFNLDPANQQRVWIKQVDRAPGADLQAGSSVSIDVGYELQSVPEATLSLGFVRADHQVHVCPPVRITASAHDVQVLCPLTVNYPQDEMFFSTEGMATLQANLLLSTGIDTTTVLLQREFDVYQYRVRRYVPSRAQ